MKKHILAFASVASLVDNAPGRNSTLGELSTWSQTFTKHRGEYTDTGIPGIRLNTFSVKEDGTDRQVDLDYEEYSIPLRVVKSLIDYARGRALPIDPNDFRDAVQADNFENIENLRFGELEDNGSITLPSWIGFNSKKSSKDVYTIWLADIAFRLQYPEFEITVIAPVEDLTKLYGPWQAGVNAMIEQNNSKLMARVQAAKDLHPETYVRYFEFDYVNQINSTQKRTSSWYILVYGEAGDNDDAIKDAIISYLVKNTGKNEAVWEKIFPELFKRTEFILYPRWDLESVPNMSTLTGLYSSFLGLENSINYAITNTPFYPAPHVKANSFTFPVTYKGLGVVGVNGINNADGMLDMRTLWRDYIAIPSTSPDFQRMQPATQEWVHFLIRCVEAAETATGSSALPQGMRRSRRGDLWYISASYNKANYMFAMRRNFTGEIA